MFLIPLAPQPLLKINQLQIGEAESRAEMKKGNVSVEAFPFFFSTRLITKVVCCKGTAKD